MFQAFSKHIAVFLQEPSRSKQTKAIFLGMIMKGSRCYHWISSPVEKVWHENIKQKTDKKDKRKNFRI